MKHIDRGAYLVYFYSGTLHWTVINWFGKDGSIVDDKGRTVHIYEFSGTV